MITQCLYIIEILTGENNLTELSFSKQAKLEMLENLKYPKYDCCKQNFIKGYIYDAVKGSGFTDIRIQPDL